MIEQVNNFIAGMVRDLDPSKTPPDAYYHAVNITLSSVDGMVRARRIAGDGKINFSFPQSVIPVAAFECMATYGSQKLPRESVVVFALSQENLDGYIYIVDTSKKLKGEEYSVHLIYDDSRRPIRDRSEPIWSAFYEGFEMDLYVYGDADDYYAYWVDNASPMRHIRLHVQNPSVLDNATAQLSPLYIANEPDLLYVQPLYPVNELELSSVEEDGALAAGSHYFWYRYYNSETGRYSTWSLPLGPVDIVPSPLGASINDTYGGLPGTITNKSVVLKVDKNHFHHLYYDSIQVATSYSGGGAELQLRVTSPSKAWFFLLNHASLFKITGTEEFEIMNIEEVQEPYAQILSGRTLEIANGRAYLGAPVYWDLEVPEPTDLGAQTIRVPYSGPTDLLAGPQYSWNDEKGYGKGPLASIKAGYWRGEVYRFARSYVNKFGFWAAPKPFDFSGVQYQITAGADPNDQWSKNHSAGPDWKFCPRDYRNGCIFSLSGEWLDAFHLRFQGLDNHPSWAYGLAIFRLPRKADILGQAPVIPGAAFQGGALMQAGADTLSAGTYTTAFQTSPYGWDYDGSEDFAGPKIIARGHAKNLTYMYIPDGTYNGLQDIRWENAYWRTGLSQAPGYNYGGFIYSPRRVNLIWMHPLEYLASEDGSGLILQGNEVVNVIDVYALQSFLMHQNAQEIRPGYTEAGGYVNQRGGQYSWVYVMRANANCYRYFWNYDFLDPSALPGLSTPVINTAAKQSAIIKAYKLFWGNEPVVAGTPLSKDAAMQHIRLICNEYNLAVAQTKNADAFWKDVQMIPPGDSYTQKALVLDLGDEVPSPAAMKGIHDPTAFIYTNYVAVGAAAPFYLLFGTSAPMSSGDPRAESDVMATADDWTEAQGAQNDYANHPVITPASSSVFFLANIRRGLGDERYGEPDTIQNYIYTGAYKIITGADIEDNTIFSMDVAGGDCYLTRLTAQVRQNAMRRHGAEMNGNDNRYLEVGSGEYYFKKFARACNFIDFVETIDCWVEASVNGLHLFRSRDAYPDGVSLAPVNNDQLASTNAAYGTMKPFLSPRLYERPSGMFRDNLTRLWASKDLRQAIVGSPGSRIHISTQNILNRGMPGFGYWRAADFYDLPGDTGAISKIVYSDQNSLISVCADGVYVIYLGQVERQNTEGGIELVQTSIPINYAKALRPNTEGVGDAGSQHLRMVRKAPGGVYFFDLRRGQVCRVERETITVESPGRVATQIQSIVKGGSSESLVLFGFWISKGTEQRIGWILDKFGLCYLDQLKVFETFLKVPETTSFIGLARDVGIAIINEAGYIFRYDNDPSEPMLMGGDAPGEIWVSLNGVGTQAADIPKSLISAQADGEGSDPGHAELLIPETSQYSDAVQFSARRRHAWIYNRFSEAGTAQRLSGRTLLLKIALPRADTLIRRIILTYRKRNR